MEEETDECKIGLGLSIGISSSLHHHDQKLHILFPPRPRSPKEEEDEEHHHHHHQQQEQSKIRRLVDSDHEDDKGGGGCARKKLRLSREQATLLEDTFREHNTLSSFQKQELAAKLNLRPRQVEIWFQNRRARNKLKQTEVDFQLLKKWCETLNEENRRLKKELQELKLIKQREGSTLYLDLPKVASGARMGLCPSCDGPSTTAASSKKSTSGDSSIAC